MPFPLDTTHDEWLVPYLAEEAAVLGDGVGHGQLVQVPVIRWVCLVFCLVGVRFVQRGVCVCTRVCVYVCVYICVCA